MQISELLFYSEDACLSLTTLVSFETSHFGMVFELRCLNTLRITKFFPFFGNVLFYLGQQMSQNCHRCPPEESTVGVF